MAKTKISLPPERNYGWDEETASSNVRIFISRQAMSDLGESKNWAELISFKVKPTIAFNIRTYVPEASLVRKSRRFHPSLTNADDIVERCEEVIFKK